MKKVIKLTESDLEQIVRRVIKEQSEERKLIMAVQKFLNDKDVLNAKLVEDGKTGEGSQTEKAIMKLQQMLKVLPADGVWGEDTQDALEKNPRLNKIWKKYKPSLFF